MSTRCNIEFYYEQQEKGKWDCSCEDQKYSKGPAGQYCHHIIWAVRQRALSSISTIEVRSRSRRGVTHTVTYTVGKDSKVLAARLYQHSDGYPDGIIPQLRRLEDIVSGNNQAKSIYGIRIDDPEWCAAEYVSTFRQPGTGNIYVSQELHGDIAYLYKVYCHMDGFHIEVFTPNGDEDFLNVTNCYHPLTGAAIKSIFDRKV